MPDKARPTPPQEAQLKKALSAVWAKESDPKETYQFDFLGSAWSCTRSNDAGSRKFTVTYDSATGYVWWAQSYFLDASELCAHQQSAKWYRAADTSKKKAAFLWRRGRDVPVPSGSGGAPTAPASRPPTAAGGAVKPMPPMMGPGKRPTSVLQRGMPLPPGPPPPAPSASEDRAIASSSSPPVIQTDFGDPVQVKRLLSAVWAKERDQTETYEFDLAGATSWGCIRKNDSGSRRFQLSFDSKAQRLWWGESYFLDPAELASGATTAKWYKAADRQKQRAAFTWKKVKTVPLPSSILSKDSDGSRSMGAMQRQHPGMRDGLSGQVMVMGDGRSSSSRGGSSSPLPEVIIDRPQLLVIYKPPYWKCDLPEGGVKKRSPEVPIKRNQDEHVLLQWLRDKVQDINEELFEEDFNPAVSGTGFGPLSHRIDAETSGPLIVAKTSQAQKYIKNQFHKTEVAKRYVCLVHGRVAQSSGEINDPIRTIRTATATKSEISQAGDWAHTSYQVIATFAATATKAAYTLVACAILSGRTHQIRVHLNNLGHPLVSDDKYQNADQARDDRRWCPRLFLHCYRLGFKNMRNEAELVMCPLPPDLKLALTSLGAADENGLSSDKLFGEVSWHREVLRPPLTSWQPGTLILRKVVELLASMEEAASPESLSEDEALKTLLAEEGQSSLGKAWFGKHWRIFQAETCSETGDMRVKLRPEHTSADGLSEEVTLEQQLESVQSELEELRRQKQRAVSQEAYIQAAEIKRRIEAITAELDSLVAFQNGGMDDGGGGSKASRRLYKDGPEQPKEKPTFMQDVRDETLFPSLSPSKGSSLQRSKSVQRPATASEGARGAATVRASSASASSRAAVSQEEAAETVVSLKEALVEFLEAQEGSIAHINEVNNNRYLRQVMRAQPKPVIAVNKAWLKANEDTFALLKTKDNETYIATVKALEAQAKARASKKNGDKLAHLLGSGEAKPHQPAYNRVIQKVAGLDHVPPLVYDYGTTSKENASPIGPPEKFKEQFLAVLHGIPHRFCKAEELLEQVPKFANIMGIRKPRALRDALVMFLESCGDTFRVECKGAGSEKEVVVFARE